MIFFLVGMVSDRKFNDFISLPVIDLFNSLFRRSASIIEVTVLKLKYANIKSGDPKI